MENIDNPAVGSFRSSVCELNTVFANAGIKATSSNYNSMLTLDRCRAFDPRPPCSGSSSNSGPGSGTHFPLLLGRWLRTELRRGTEDLFELVLKPVDFLFQIRGMAKLTRGEVIERIIHRAQF